jgi:hypothetical protein
MLAGRERGMTFEVQLGEPWLSRVLPDGRSEELSLSALRSSDAHIHGELAIVVGGEQIPHLGFFGPSDVCVGTWLRELATARRVLADDGGRHVFDEGEQGQPAFKFERVGDRVNVSVVDSEISDGVGDPEWGIQSCTVVEFTTGVTNFFATLESTLEEAAPGVGRLWVHRFGNSG